MKISFSPVRSDQKLALKKTGDMLDINGVAYDFSALADGELLPKDAVDSEWLASDIERIDGQIHLTLTLPHGPNAGPETLFPETICAEDGEIDIPAHEVTA